MAWRNSAAEFGLVSRVLHWGMALGILAMLALGTTIADMEPGLANLWLYGLHKSMGLVLLALVVARLIWHRISPPPAPIGGGIAAVLAQAAHATLYVLMLAIPLAGWVASSATGIDVMLFDRWVVPPIAPVSEAWERWGFIAHGLLTKALFALVVVHALAALKRAWTGDGTLRRMIFGRTKG